MHYLLYHKEIVDLRIEFALKTQSAIKNKDFLEKIIGI